MSPADVAALAAQLPDRCVRSDPDVLASYRQDEAHDPNAGDPLAVVRPTCTADVQVVLRWASAARVPVVVRGAGTGLSGGASAVSGGVVLSTERMRTITVDPASRTAVAQPGALNTEVKAAAAEHGLWYPPDPASYQISTIGGNAATNAGGLCCVKYGVTTDYMLGVEVVLADGSMVRLGGPRLKDVAGLSLVKLFVGSEGVLGVITEVTVRLLPPQPPASTLVAEFPTFEAAAEAVVAIVSAMRPAMLELMDHASINAVEDLLAMGLDRSAGAQLLASSDSPGASAAAEIAEMTKICAGCGASEVFSTDDPADGEAFSAARRSSHRALERLGDLLLEDVGVPVPQLPALVRGIEAIGAEHGVLIATVAHAGDGNAHPVIVYDRSDDAATARAYAAFDAIMALAIALGGTITGEHGVGRLKRGWLPAYLGEDVMALSRRIKAALDPAGILNPGAVL